MLARLIKLGMPRSLGGRTTLILLVPIVTILVVVSIIVFQRLYDGVSRQMSAEIAREITFVLQSENPEGFATALGLRIVETRTDGLTRDWDDLSGKSIHDALRTQLPGLTGVDLTGDGIVRIGVEGAAGPVTVEVGRTRLSARNPHQLLVVLGLTAALMTLIAWLYLRNQVRPIKRLAVAAEAFGKGRTIPYRPSGATEVRSAGGAFIGMRERIERQARQRALFLSGVSHDLRTPLTRLRLELGLMEETAETAAMRRDVDEMQAMLDAFLAYARADAENAALEAVEPAALAREVMDEAIRAGMRVTEWRIEEGGLIRLSPLAVKRALMNLIGNADRYAGGGQVSVVLGDDDVELIVEDAGPGIPADQRDAAIRPFERLDQSRNQDRGAGTGLGLAIASDVMSRHGGRLVLSDSERLSGLRASLILPR